MKKRISRKGQPDLVVDLTEQEIDEITAKRAVDNSKAEHYAVQRQIRYVREIDPFFIEALSDFHFDGDRTKLDELEAKKFSIKLDIPK